MLQTGAVPLASHENQLQLNGSSLILDKATELNFYESGKTAESEFLLLPRAGQAGI